MKLRIATSIICIIGLSLVNAWTVDAAQALPASISKNKAYTLGKCNFIINGQVDGMFMESHGSGTYTFNYTKTSNAWGFGIDCRAGAKSDEIETQLDAKQVNGQWIWVSSGEPFEAGQHFKVYNFSGKNWSGVGDTYDDTTGDEASRQRYFNYCLTQSNGPQILCGRVQVADLNDIKRSKLEEVLSVLKAIEFVDPQK